MRTARPMGGRRVVVLLMALLSASIGGVIAAAAGVVLCELERRQKTLDTQMPSAVLGVVYTVITALQLATSHSVMNTIGWLLIWGFFAGSTVLSIRERRRRPQLRMMIDHLRRHPVELPSATG